ncbi:MAG: hypothetical protein NZ840_03405 [Anaerolineales bacterium]|nr:hypothetical protein [Anaerolineales bacterium]MDW8161079.1 hypothetical protein [Anaerolineales bacterium]
MGQPQLVLLSLVGEQPIPNLLPLWQFTHYTEVQFIASATTRSVAKQLKKAIQQDEALQHLQALKTLEVPPITSAMLAQRSLRPCSSINRREKPSIST